MNKTGWIILIWALLSFHSTFLHGQETARGFVFEDLNNNRTKDRKEKGIARVAVSNGVDVVLTGTDGAYNIPISPGQILFVIKPADFVLPVNDHNQPQFFYIHKPLGSPKLTYAPDLLLQGISQNR